MKKITFIRHGKSSWEHPVSDRDRTLKDRGIRDVALIAGHYGERAESAGEIISSPAIRALHTAEIAARTWGRNPTDIRVLEEMYDFSGEQVLGVIRGLDRGLKHAILFGHNEAFTYLVNHLGDRFLDNLPTAGLAEIVFESENWEPLGQGRTQLILRPSELKSHD